MAVQQQQDSAVWRFQAWASFFIASGTTGAGIAFLPTDGWIKAFLGMGLLFTMGSCFSLAKTMRDAHEQQKLLAKIDEAKTHRLIKEFELDGVKSAA